ncbi:hypothetical protein ABIC03_003554 [Bradyrhizobium sp. RT6a]|uniref:hypothetical protein n=1 Tax=Bradyrhizobium sp. RT6a TaxID=3156381 RepID=UPI0033998C4D
MTLNIPDLYHICPKLREAEQRAEELKARAIAERAKWQQIHDRRLNGPSESDRASAIEAVLAGRELPDDEAEFRKQRDITFAVEDAAEQAEKSVPAIRRAAGREYTNTLRRDHDRMQKAFFAKLIDMKIAYDELHDLKRAIQSQGVGVHDLFQVDAQQLLGVPTDPSCELNYLIREGHKAGYCKKVV